MTQWDNFKRSESPKLYVCVHSQMIVSDGTKMIYYRKDYFQQITLKYLNICEVGKKESQ